MPLPPPHTGATSLGPVHPEPDTARRWLEDELSDPAYHRQGWVERVLEWLAELWARLSTAAADAPPLVAAAAVGVVVLLVVLAGVALTRVRAERAAPRAGAAPSAAPDTSAAEHRRAAGEAVREGRHRDAVVEGFRAIAAGVVERGLLEARPGTTAHEIVDALVPLFPHRAAALRRAGERFDAVLYGDRVAHEVDARAVMEVEADLARDVPDPLASPDAEVVR